MQEFPISPIPRRSLARANDRFGGLSSVVVCVFFLAAGCATKPPANDVGRVPSAEERPRAASNQRPDATTSRAERPHLDRAPTNATSFDFALNVLESKGRQKLDAAQRQAVARALALGEEEYGLSVVLLLAMIQLESGFDPSAKGPSGSIGLMQLQPATAREIAERSGLAWKSKRTLLDPEQNTRLGLAYLAQLRERFGTTEHAVAAYNIGPGNLRRLLARRPLSPGPYLTKVYAHVDALHEEFGE